MPVSRSVWARAATSADSDGWLVVPDSGAAAASTASTPAALAASSVASWPPGGVVRVQVHRKVEALAERRHELRGRGRPQQARHVLDREDVRAGLDDLLGEPQVVVERVERLARVEQVGRVADRDLGDGVPVSRTASMAGRICATSLRASKIRKMSTPVAAASRTNASATSTGRGV